MVRTTRRWILAATLALLFTAGSIAGVSQAAAYSGAYCGHYPVNDHGWQLVLRKESNVGKVHIHYYDELYWGRYVVSYTRVCPQ